MSAVVVRLGADETVGFAHARVDLSDKTITVYSTNVTVEPIAHDGIRVTVRGERSLVYPNLTRGGGFSAYPAGGSLRRDTYPTQEDAVRALVRIEALRRGATP